MVPKRATATPMGFKLIDEMRLKSQLGSDCSLFKSSFNLMLFFRI